MDLIEVSGAAGVTRAPAHGTRVRIGRDADNDVVLADQPAASRHHAELGRDAQGWTVLDLDSRNGTWLNGARLSTPARLGVADVVGIGEVTLRLVQVQAAEMTVEGGAAADLHRLATLLSGRERAVLALVAAGRTDDQVARELYISVKTVHSHLDRIRDKSGVRRRAELTRLAVRLGLSASGP